MVNKLKKTVGTLLTTLLILVQILSGAASLGNAQNVYGADAAVTSITLDKETISFEGGEVNISVEGEGLTADNWGIDIQVYYSGTTQIAGSKASSVTISDQTANGATLTVSSNGMKNDLDVVVRAGVKTGSGDSDDEEAGIEEQVEAKFTIEGKNYSTTKIDAVGAVLSDDSTVQVTFDEDVELADADNAYKKVSFVSSDNKSYSLTSEDTVSAEGAIITISLHDSLIELLDCSNSATVNVVFGERTLRLSSTAANTYNQEFNWYVTTKASISRIDLDKDVFDYRGGTVTATLNGFNASSISLNSIQANLLVAGSNASSGIELSKGNAGDGTPTITFTVPKNDSSKTKSYYLNVSVNGTPVYQATTENKANLAIVSVVPEGTDTDAATISAVSISANGGSTPIEGGVETVVSKSIGSLKTEIRIFGTGLNDTTTKLRITDENGIEWPVYAIAECDATWRFLALSGIRGNGIFGNGNTQIIELLPARYAGTNKTYTIEVAPDGKNFDSASAIKLRINNEGINDEVDFRDCTSDNFKYVTVNYIDESGNKIADSDTYKGYEITMTQQFGIKAKDIDGYELIKSPELSEWVGQGTTYEYVYKQVETEDDDPVYNDIPGYQKKNVFETATNTIRGLKVTGTYDSTLEFKVFNTTTQEEETRVKPVDGILPELKLKKNHNYIISAIDGNHESKTYIWNDNGTLKNIKSNYKSNVADKDWVYDEVTSLAVSKTKSSGEDRYTAQIQVYIGDSDTPAAKKTFKLISAFETVEATTKSNGILTASLLEDVAYTVTIDDPTYGVQSFPLVVKDKSEYGRLRYTYDHSTCHFVGINPSTGKQEVPICLVEKDKAHEKDSKITSSTGKTTVSGFKFNDLIVKESKLNTTVKSLKNNTYEVISVKVINPHRWEVSKIASGDFTITEKYDYSRTVKNVYLLKDDGSLENVDYEIKDGRVEISTTSLSLYPVVIEYTDQKAGDEDTDDTEDVSDRIAGPSRYDTALESANELKKVSKTDSFDTIIVASGVSYPDALAGGYLAKVKDAPIVLVSKDSKVESKVKRYIDENLSSNGTVFILGGNGSVSANFEKSISGYGYTVTRLGGSSRYDTNIEILKAAGVTTEELLVCTGANFADSLSASAVGKPIFLVGNSLTESQRSYLKTLKPEKITAIGGTGAVSNSVFNEVRNVTGNEAETGRISGANRYATSVEIAKEYFGSNPSKVIISTGINFPDGLSGGPLAMKVGAPILLISTSDYSAARSYCKSAESIERSIALGGTTMVSENARLAMLK